MVQQLRGWVDYDRPYLPALQAPARIDYFEKRVRLVAISPLERLLKTEIHVSGSSALLIYGVALCCAIEATGKFMQGSRGRNADRFHAFLTYMSPDFAAKKLGQMTYGQVLWSYFRNGLAHGFAVRHGGFEGNRGDVYFNIRSIAGHPVLMVNPFLLYDDFVRGFDRYLADLRASQPTGALYQSFDKVFESVFIQGK